MKLRVYVEVDVSKSLAETIQRSGFRVEPDGSGLKVCVSNAPSVPKRKTQIRFQAEPEDTLEDIISLSKRPLENAHGGGS